MGGYSDLFRILISFCKVLKYKKGRWIVARQNWKEEQQYTEEYCKIYTLDRVNIYSVWPKHKVLFHIYVWAHFLRLKTEYFV